jgi:hypothetical protein
VCLIVLSVPNDDNDHWFSPQVVLNYNKVYYLPIYDVTLGLSRRRGGGFGLLWER